MEKIGRANGPCISSISVEPNKSALKNNPAPFVDSLTSMQPSKASACICSKICKKICSFFSFVIQWITCRRKNYKKQVVIVQPKSLLKEPLAQLQQKQEQKQDSGSELPLEPILQRESDFISSSAEIPQEIKVGIEKHTIDNSNEKKIKEPLIVFDDLKKIGEIAIKYFCIFLTREGTKFKEWIEQGKDVSIVFQASLEPLHRPKEEAAEGSLYIENGPNEVSKDTMMIVDFMVDLLQEEWKREVDRGAFKLKFLTTIHPDIPKAAFVVALKIKAEEEEERSWVYTTIHFKTETSIWREGMKNYFYEIAKMPRSERSFPVSSFFSYPD